MSLQLSPSEDWASVCNIVGLWFHLPNSCVCAHPVGHDIINISKKMTFCHLNVYISLLNGNEQPDYDYYWLYINIIS